VPFVIVIYVVNQESDLTLRFVRVEKLPSQWVNQRVS